MPLPRLARWPLVAALLCMAACAPKPPSDGTADAPGSAAAPAVPDLDPVLVAYHWRLETAVDANGQSIAALFPDPANPLGLEFVDGQLGVTGSCNRIGASYQLVDTQLKLGAARSTMMACLPPLDAADAAIGKFLTGTLQADVQRTAETPSLRLAAADGSVLKFAGRPTPETRFGGPGTRAFLEVSAEPCHLQSEASPGCLRVRDVHFDEQGLPSGEPGEWHGLPAGIEGYARTPGQQQVVRVKRFETRDSAGGEPTVHFVFDMVVESRTVERRDHPG